MRIHIVSNIDNGKGLERDYRLLRSVLESWGHEVRGVHFQRTDAVPPADLAIFLEVYEAPFAALAPRRWLVPNPEWWTEERDPLLGDFEVVGCKTEDALRRFARLTPKARWCGFMSEDRHSPSIARARRCLHVAGGSTAKGTEAVLAAWAQWRMPCPLTVVSSLRWSRQPPGVTFLPRLEDARLRHAQNEHLLHLCPSEYEGWGHSLHEGLSVGAAVLVPDRVPFTEVAGCAARIPAHPAGTRGVAGLARVEPSDIRDAVERCADFTDAELRRVAAAAREAFLDERERFLKSLWELLGEPRPPASRRPSSPATGTPLPRVAVVFPCHASGAPRVRRSVLALRAQTAAPSTFEVVVACDGGDADGALRAAVAPDAHPFRVTFVESARPRGAIAHRNHARNAGWRASRAPLAVMLDADFLLPPHAIEHLLHEHDASVRRGLPAVFTPVLANVDLSPEAWLDHSAAWASSGDTGEHARLIKSVPVAGGVYSGYEDLYRPGPPSSQRLVDLLEGMPVVWRGLLDALGGFDEWFVGWGAEKEAFVDLLKGLQRAGLIDVRLLSSVRALHQPHSLDPEAGHRDVRKRQSERERRATQIRDGARWWRERLDVARVALPDAVTAAREDAGRTQHNTTSSTESRSARVAQVLAVAAPMLRGRYGGVVVAGEAAELVAEKVVEVCGLATRIAGAEELGGFPTGFACGVILSGVLGGLSAMERTRLICEARRVTKATGPLVIAERHGEEGGALAEELAGHGFTLTCSHHATPDHSVALWSGYLGGAGA